MMMMLRTRKFNSHIVVMLLLLLSTIINNFLFWSDPIVQVVDAIDPPRMFGLNNNNKKRQSSNNLQNQPLSTLSSTTTTSSSGSDYVHPTVHHQQQGGGGGGGDNKIVLTPQQQIQQRARGGALAVAGTFSGIIKKVRSELDWELIRTSIKSAFDILDVVALGAIGWLTEPITRHIYKIKHRKLSKTDSDFDVIEVYENSRLFKIVCFIQELGRLGIVMYGVDMMSVGIRKAGFPISTELNTKIGKSSVVIWCATRIRRLKQLWLRSAMKKEILSGRSAILNNVINGALDIIVLFFIFDIFQIQIGKGFQSIAAFGGVSTIIFSLAAKDFAQMLLSGLAIYNSDKFDEGEKVKFGDGTAGKIEKIGAFELQVLGSDGIITRIPNVHITNQRVQNLSRTQTSTIKQTLWFRYEDIYKLPAALETIKDEIKKACPKLISDGSRTFRAVWTDYQHDHLEAIVEASFNIPITSPEYDNNKQTMLQAIANAVNMSGIQFAMPTSLCLSEEVKK